MFDATYGQPHPMQVASISMSVAISANTGPAPAPTGFVPNSPYPTAMLNGTWRAP
jgi:hypothetical protein